MKTVALIPYWSDYAFPEESIGGRDTIKLGGHALINYTIRSANKVPLIDEVVIYASDDRILGQLDGKGRYRFVTRDKDLDNQGVSIEAIIDRFLSVYEADILVLMHPKTPFLKPSTIAACIDKVKGGEFDSSFVVTKARKFAWFKGVPLNYSLNADTPSLSQIEPVMLESSSLYVFGRALFAQTHHRIGVTPYLHEIGHFEGFEVDRPDDYEIAELIVNAGFELTGD